MVRSGPTRAEKKAKTREQLVSAAAAVFARRGFSGASLEEIAEEAGLTRGAYYAHFASKEDLLAAVMTSFVVDMDLSMFDDSRPLAEQVEAFGDRLAQAVPLVAHGIDLELEVVRLACHNTKVAAGVAAAQKREIDALAASLERRALETGIALSMNPTDLATAVLALVRGLLIVSLASPGRVRGDLFATSLRALIGV